MLLCSVLTLSYHILSFLTGNQALSLVPDSRSSQSFSLVLVLVLTLISSLCTRQYPIQPTSTALATRARFNTECWDTIYTWRTSTTSNQNLPRNDFIVHFW